MMLLHDAQKVVHAFATSRLDHLGKLTYTALAPNKILHLLSNTTIVL